MFTETVEAEPMAMGAISVEGEAVETQIVEFRMSCRRILRDRVAFHKRRSRPQGLELSRVM